MTRRQWLVLTSYFLLLLLFVGGVIAPAVFPGIGAMVVAGIGPLFILLGAHLIFFRTDHASIWETWGGPSPAAFLMVGFFFLGIGVLFIVGR